MVLVNYVRPKGLSMELIKRHAKQKNTTREGGHSQQISRLNRRRNLADREADGNDDAISERRRTHRIAGNYTIKSLLSDSTASESFSREPSEESTFQGLPMPLRRSLEALSQTNLSDVRVHRNSQRPSRFDARAFTVGRDIYLRPGEEEHLPHEAWHAVQQIQGRVQATRHIDGVPVNEDETLEQEADIKSKQAMKVSGRYIAETSGSSSTHIDYESAPITNASGVVQREGGGLGESEETAEAPSSLEKSNLPKSISFVRVFITRNKIYEYNFEGDKQGYFEKGDILLERKLRSQKLIDLHSELAPERPRTPLLNPEYKTAYIIDNIVPDFKGEGGGYVIVRPIIYFKSGDEVKLQEKRWDRDHFERAIRNYRRYAGHRALMPIVEGAVKTGVFLLGGGVVKKTIRKAVRGGVARTARTIAKRSVRRLIVRFYRVLSGSAAKAVGTFFVELAKDLVEQSQQAELFWSLEREVTISKEAAIARAATAAATTFVNETIGRRLSGALEKSIRELHDVDPIIAATLETRLRDRITIKVIEAFTVDKATVVMNAVGKAFAKGIRSEEDWTKFLEGELKKELKSYLQGSIKSSLSTFTVIHVD